MSTESDATVSVRLCKVDPADDLPWRGPVRRRAAGPGRAVATRVLLAAGVAFALGVATERWRRDWTASGRAYDRVTERVPRS